MGPQTFLFDKINIINVKKLSYFYDLCCKHYFKALNNQQPNSVTLC